MRDIDPTSLEAIVNEFHGDYKEDIDEFSLKYSQEVLSFCKLICDCFKKYKLFDRNKNPSLKESYTASLTYSAIDNMYTSVKLLAVGYLVPSGNMYRQAIESVCMAILLSSPVPLLLQDGKRAKPVDFFDAFESDDKLALSHRALDHVERNAADLGINHDSLQKIIKTKLFYNKFSHASKFAIGLRSTGTGDDAKWIIGGGVGYDDLDIPRREMSDRIGFTRMIPSVIEELYNRVKE